MAKIYFILFGKKYRKNILYTLYFLGKSMAKKVAVLTLQNVKNILYIFLGNIDIDTTYVK